MFSPICGTVFALKVKLSERRVTPGRGGVCVVRSEDLRWALLTLHVFFFIIEGFNLVVFFAK